MILSFLAYLLPLASFVAGQDTSLRAVKDAFNAADIPSDLNIKFHPRVLLEASFPQTSGNPVTLHAGIHVPQNATAILPTFSMCGLGAREGPLVVAVLDPDAPTPQAPTLAQILHFLGGNFTGTRTSSGCRELNNSTAAITQFRQPAPPAGSDAHRYIFLLFDQPPTFNSQTVVTSTTDITLFNISKFADATDLGSPIAGTFMFVAPDPPVT